MKILNLYAGIGGNRKLWPDGHEITAVEINPEIAKIYKEFFPADNIVVGDAHEYLLKNFRDFDCIWASPPCPTHSKYNLLRGYSDTLKYPDMTLYQEILLLKTFFKGRFIVENVRPYYTPLVNPDIIMGRHYYWTNGWAMPYEADEMSYTSMESCIDKLQNFLGFDLSKFNIKNKRQILRNCVIPADGKYLFEKYFCHNLHFLTYVSKNLGFPRVS